MASKGKQYENAQTTDASAEQIAEVEEIINADVETLRPSQRAVLELLSGLEGLATEDTDTSGGFFGDDIAAILMADDEATMWEADELPRINAKVLSGCELDLYGWDVRFSDSPDIVTGLIGPNSKRKMYLLVKSARLNDSGDNKGMYRLPEVGEEFTWNTSARFIVAKLYWLAKRGRFDNGSAVKARIKGTPLGGGKSVEKLKPLEGAFVQATAEPPF
jgi:hypothetical protein